jgi:cobalt-zinc-cadmium efflux system outer membrane protein
MLSTTLKTKDYSILSCLTLIVCILSLGTVTRAAVDREQVSKQLIESTGEGLNPDATAGRSFSLPPGVEGDSSLSEQEAVAIALWNSPGLETVLSELDLGRADLLQAGVLVNPSFSALFGIGSKPFEFLLSMPIQAFWQRPRRVAAAKMNLEMISEGLVQSGLDLVRDTRIAHAELVTAQERARLDSEASKLLSEIADLTAKREAAGDISELEARLVRLDSINAANRASRSQRDVELAQERLRVLMGAADEFPDLRAEASVSGPQILPEGSQLVEEALSSRPDLRAAELGIEAAGERAGWERTRIFNLVAPQLSTKEVGSSGFKTGPGLSIELPLFDRNQGGVSRAEAELRRATLLYLEAAEQVKFEVRSSRLRFLQAREALDRLRGELLPVLRETVELAEKAYANGNISYLDLQVAKRPLLDTLLTEELAMLDLRRAQAELERAVGRRL